MMPPSDKRKDQDRSISEGLISRVSRAAEKVIAVPPSRSDPQGSYTGRPVETGEIPIQDADDL